MNYFSFTERGSAEETYCSEAAGGLGAAWTAATGAEYSVRHADRAIKLSASSS